MVLAEDGDQVVVYGVNETQQAVTGQLRYGVFALAGGWPLDERAQVSLPANSSTALASFPRSRWSDPRSSLACAMLEQGGRLLARNRLVLPFFKELAWTAASPTVSLANGQAIFQSSTFTWGVCLDLEGDARLGDNFFDLYPGVPYSVPWSGAQPPRILRIGNLAPAR